MLSITEYFYASFHDIIVAITMFISTKLFKTDRHFLAFSFLLSALVCSHVDPNEKTGPYKHIKVFILFIFRFQSLFSSGSTRFSLFLTYVCLMYLPSKGGNNDVLSY